MLIHKEGTFDAAHRVMNEKMKCFNIHGHTYLYTLYFEFFEMDDIGYAIDFKEIKRVYMEFIDEYFDHAIILNPHDEKLRITSMELKSKIWVMSLNGSNQYCNPTAENIAKEILILIDNLIMIPGLNMHSIKLMETPKSGITEYFSNIHDFEKQNVLSINKGLLSQFKKSKGVIQYDDRK